MIIDVITNISLSIPASEKCKPLYISQHPLDGRFIYLIALALFIPYDIQESSFAVIASKLIYPSKVAIPSAIVKAEKNIIQNSVGLPFLTVNIKIIFLNIPIPSIAAPVHAFNSIYCTTNKPEPSVFNNTICQCLLNCTAIIFNAIPINPIP